MWPSCVHVLYNVFYCASPSLIFLFSPSPLLCYSLSPLPLSSSSLSSLSLIFSLPHLPLFSASPLSSYSLSLPLSSSLSLSLLSSPSRVCRQYMRSLNATEVEKIHEDSPTIPGRYLHISYTLSHSHVVSCIQRFFRRGREQISSLGGYKVTQTTLLSLKLNAH